MTKSLSSEFMRKIIRADFKPSDHVPEFTPTGWSPVASSRSYLSASSGGKLVSRMFRFLALAMHGLVFLAVVIGWNSLAGEDGWLQLTAVLLGLYSLWMTLIGQAYLRWMYRHRSSPKR